MAISTDSSFADRIPSDAYFFTGFEIGGRCGMLAWQVKYAKQSIPLSYLSSNFAKTNKNPLIHKAGSGVYFCNMIK